MTTTRPSRRPPERRLRAMGRTLTYRHHPARGEAACVPVVLIHGFGGDNLSWGRTAQALAAAGHDTFALDLPGHGGSDLDVGDGSLGVLSDAVCAAVDALDLVRVALVGHSLGGLVAMAVALQLNRGAGGGHARVESVALIAPAGIQPRPGAAFLRDFVAADSRSALGEAMADLVAPPATAPRAVVEHVWRWKQRDGVAAGLNRLMRRAFIDDSGALLLPGAALAAARIPTLILWGERDAVIAAPGPGDTPEHACVEILPGLGHSPHLEDPTAVLARLTAFLRDPGLVR